MTPKSVAEIERLRRGNRRLRWPALRKLRPDDFTRRMGRDRSVQWSGQADLTLTIAATSKFERDGNSTRRTFALRFPKGGRGALVVEDSPEHVEVRGRLTADGGLESLSIDHPRGEPTMHERVLAALADRALGRKALAEAAGTNQTGSKFRETLDELRESRSVLRNDDGLYAAV